MPHSLTKAEAAALTAEISRFGEVTVARESGVHRQTLARAASRRRLYARTLYEIRVYLDRISKTA
jgi:hypothetical protein